MSSSKYIIGLLFTLLPLFALKGNDTCMVQIDYSDFEQDWGIWNDGGRYTLRNNYGIYPISDWSVLLSSNGPEAQITSDPLDLSSYASIKVAFKFFPTSIEDPSEDLWLAVSTDNGLSYTTIKEWKLGTDFENDVLYLDTVAINGPFNENVFIRFISDTGSGSDFFYIDDINLLGCTNDINLLCTAPTETEILDLGPDYVEITWQSTGNADNFNIQYRPLGEETWQEVEAKASPFKIENLIEDRSYEIQVQSICGDFFGAPGNPVYFTTGAGIFDCFTTLDFNDFELDLGIWNPQGEDSRLFLDFSSEDLNSSILLRSRGPEARVISNSMDLREYSQVKIAFDYFTRNFSRPNEDLWLQVSTNGGASYTRVEEWNYRDEFLNENLYLDTVLIDGPFGEETIFRFVCDASDINDIIFLDNIHISACIQNLENICDVPADFSLLGVGEEEAAFNWASVDQAQSYQLQIRAKGRTEWERIFLQDTITFLSNLAEETDYEATLSSVCNLVNSNFSPIIEFTTGEGFFSCQNLINYSDFEKEWGIWNSSGALSQRNEDTTSFIPNWRIQLGGNTEESVITSNEIDLSGALTTSIDFSYDLRFIPDGELLLQMSTDETKQFQTVATWNLRTPDEINPIDGIRSVSISGPFSEQTRFRFRSNSQDRNIAYNIDNIRIKACLNEYYQYCETPNRLKLITLNQTAAGFSWEAVEGNPSYTLEYKTRSERFWRSQTVKDTFILIGDLSPNSNYEARIKSNCSDGLSSISSAPVRFSTGGDLGRCRILVDYTSFEEGWDIWLKGGEDSRRAFSDEFSLGNWSAEIRDNTNSSQIISQNLTLRGVISIGVSFTYYARNIDSPSEGFLLQISSDGGNSFTTVQEWTPANGLLNDQFNNVQLLILGPFTSLTRLRFVSMGETDEDLIYFDDIYVYGDCGGFRGPGTVIQLKAPSDNTDKNLASLNSTGLGLTISPNPVESILNVQYSVPELEKAAIHINDLNGKLVYSKRIDSGKNRNIRLDLSQLPPACYFIHLIGTQEKISQKLIVIN